MREIRTGICRKVQKDHRGMSLVEVIVAITILGIVAVPVLHSLTTAMVYNQKARTRQEMTLTAESIMETFKGYDLETLKEQFDSRSVSIQGLQGSNYNCTPDTSYDPEKDYLFEIFGLLDEEGEVSDVDVKITATPKGTETVMVPNNAEATREAVFTGNLEFDENALQKAKNDFRKDERKSDFGTYLAANYSDAVARIGNDVFTIKDDIDKIYDTSSGIFFVENCVELLERQLEFKIERVTSSDGDEFHVTPTLVYTYCIKDYPYYVLAEEGAETSPSDEYGGTDTDSGNVAQKIKENDPPNNKIRYPKEGDEPLKIEIDISSVCTNGMIYKNPTTAGLDSLFVYYYPQYDIQDTIVIDNSAQIDDFKCYILKQNANITPPTLEAKENTYRPTVKIGTHGMTMKVFHNLDVNLGDITKRVGGGADGISHGVEKISYYYKEPTDPATDPNLGEFEAFLSDEKRTLYYELTIEVLKNGNSIAELKGSMNEPIK